MLRLCPTEISISSAEIDQTYERFLAKQAYARQEYGRQYRKQRTRGTPVASSDRHQNAPSKSKRRDSVVDQVLSTTSTPPSPVKGRTNLLASLPFRMHPPIRTLPPIISTHASGSSGPATIDVSTGHSDSPYATAYLRQLGSPYRQSTRQYFDGALEPSPNDAGIQATADLVADPRTPRSWHEPIQAHLHASPIRAYTIERSTVGSRISSPTPTRYRAHPPSSLTAHTPGREEQHRIRHSRRPEHDQENSGSAEEMMMRRELQLRRQREEDGETMDETPPALGRFERVALS